MTIYSLKDTLSRLYCKAPTITVHLTLGKCPQSCFEKVFDRNSSQQQQLCRSHPEPFQYMSSNTVSRKRTHGKAELHMCNITEKRLRKILFKVYDRTLEVEMYLMTGGLAAPRCPRSISDGASVAAHIVGITLRGWLFV